MEAVFERILTEKFEELMKDVTMQEAECILRRRNKNFKKCLHTL